MKPSVVLISLIYFCAFSCLANEVQIPLLMIKGANWSVEELAYIKQLNHKGSLKVATKISSAIYQPHKDGSVTGFHYSVLKEFADLAKIELDIELVSWNDYFYKEGEDIEKVKVDPNYSYVPTLIERVDLYLDGITRLAWREKMFDIVKFVPTRQMIVSRFDNKPTQASALNNKTCAMVKNSSMEENLKKIKRQNQIDFSCLYTEDFNAMDKMVSEGQADFTVFDSDRAFSAVATYKNLTIAWPISEPQIMGWAINKKNRLLKGILDKYIKYAHESAILDKYWKRSYGVTFVEYMNVLNLGGAKH